MHVVYFHLWTFCCCCSVNTNDIKDKCNHCQWSQVWILPNPSDIRASATVALAKLSSVIVWRAVCSSSGSQAGKVDLMGTQLSHLVEECRSTERETQGLRSRLDKAEERVRSCTGSLEQTPTQAQFLSHLLTSQVHKHNRAPLFVPSSSHRDFKGF